MKAGDPESQGQGFKIADLPEGPRTDEEKAIKAKYSKVLGSAVSPVLREGIPDRRAAGPVRDYAKQHPHKIGPWSKDSRNRVRIMSEGDFLAGAKSAKLAADETFSIESGGKM